MGVRGGKQLGAGRPKVAERAEVRSIRITDKRWIKYQALGGNRWLSRKIDEEIIDEPAKVEW